MQIGARTAGAGRFWAFFREFLREFGRISLPGARGCNGCAGGLTEWMGALCMDWLLGILCAGRPELYAKQGNGGRGEWPQAEIGLVQCRGWVRPTLAAKTETRRGWGTRGEVKAGASYPGLRSETWGTRLGLWVHPTLAAKTKTRRGWGTRDGVKAGASYPGLRSETWGTRLGHWVHPTLAAKTETRRGWGTRGVEEIGAAGALG